MYFAGWIALIVVGVLGSLAAFLWALRSGQFEEQGRARFLPLAGECHAGNEERPLGRIPELYALWIIAALGAGAMAGAVILALVNLKG